ncbi:MAG: alpha/beta hydrolase, partial [Actinobacteria bacterium]
QVAGAPVNVIDLGEGDPMVFIHGLSGAWVNWLENLPHFAREHRVIAMDLPGFGHSPMPTEQISIAGYGQIVDELLDALGIDRAVIVGNSMGGFIGAEVAIQFSTRVEKLVLISAAGISIEHQRNEPVLRALERLDDVLILGGGWMATRSAGLARRGPARAADRRAGDGLRQARVRPRARCADRLPDPRPAARDRLPGAGGVGRGGPPRPGARRLRVRRADPERARRRVARDRARCDARAPRRVQRAGRRVPGAVGSLTWVTTPDRASCRTGSARGRWPTASTT